MKKHIPNSITCCNLISGCIATAFAFGGNIEMALLWIIIGAVFDFFDGMTARLLHVSSPIGKELDSLPFVAYIMAAFSALRLAKFNLDERQALGFIGLPTPANALFWGSLLVGVGNKMENHDWMLYIVLIGIAISSWLLVSEIPMFALKFKQWGWKGNEIKYIFLLTCIPLLLVFGITSFAIIIAWYVILSIIAKPSTAKG